VHPPRRAAAGRALSSSAAWRCRLRANCAFHDAASALRLLLSGSVSSVSGPSACTDGIAATACSTAMYFFSSASNACARGARTACAERSPALGLRKP